MLQAKSAALSFGTVVLVLLLAGGCRSYQGDSTADAASQRVSSRVTLDPMLFTGPVREAYKAAQEDPALFSKLYCYCGCERNEGHKSLLDCFRDKHGSNCEICVGEALEARRLAEEGTPVDQIRDALHARYARGS
jgi:uncharacterized protein with PCYCGC motif